MESSDHSAARTSSVRPIHWLFVISTALSVSGIGFIIAAERTRAATSSTLVMQPQAVAPVATVRQIMDGIVEPAASTVWNSVSTTVTAAGVEEKMPRTDGEWGRVVTAAALLVESANLLVDGERAVDGGDWLMMARAMAAAGNEALSAAQARSTDGISAVGEAITISCDNCHERYKRN